MNVAARPGLALSTTAVVWVALAAASLGVLADLFGLWSTDAWSRYSLVFLPLAALVSWRGAGGTAQPRLAAALVGLGAVIEVLAIGGGFDRVGRVGLGLALLGMTCLHGVEGWSRRLCVVWILPIPHVIAIQHGKLAIALMGQLGAATVALLEPELRFADASLWYDSAGLWLRGPAGGLTVLVVLAGLGWHASAFAGAPLRASAWRAARWGALGIPIQAAGNSGGRRKSVQRRDGDCAIHDSRGDDRQRCRRRPGRRHPVVRQGLYWRRRGRLFVGQSALLADPAPRRRTLGRSHLDRVVGLPVVRHS